MTDDKAIIDKLDDLMKEVQSIKRGVYGDKDNGVNGLIHHQRDHLQRLIDLEESKKKAIWFGSGAIVVLTGIWHFLIEWLKSR